MVLLNLPKTHAKTQQLLPHLAPVCNTNVTMATDCSIHLGRPKCPHSPLKKNLHPAPNSPTKVWQTKQTIKQTGNKQTQVKPCASGCKGRPRYSIVNWVNITSTKPSKRSSLVDKKLNILPLRMSRIRLLQVLIHHSLISLSMWIYHSLLSSGDSVSWMIHCESPPLTQWHQASLCQCTSHSLIRALGAVTFSCIVIWQKRKTTAEERKWAKVICHPGTLTPLPPHHRALSAHLSEVK